jgi:hypothetical protein
MQFFGLNLKERNFIIFYLKTFIALKSIISENLIFVNFVTYCACLRKLVLYNFIISKI